MNTEPMFEIIFPYVWLQERRGYYGATGTEKDAEIVRSFLESRHIDPDDPYLVLLRTVTRLGNATEQFYI